MMDITLWSFRNIPEGTVQEIFCHEMLSTIFIGLLATAKPWSLMAVWQLIREQVIHGDRQQGEVTARSGLESTSSPRDLGT